MLTFPDSLRVSESTFTPVNQSVTGGLAITGFQQWRTSPRGRWSAKVICQVVGEEEILLYRSFLVGLQGAGIECLVSPRDGVRPRDANGKMFDWRSTIAFSGGALFFGDQALTLPAAGAAHASGDAPQGSTQMAMEVTNGLGPRPGHYFGVADRIYMVTSVFSRAADVVTVVFWPRLRADVPDQSSVILDRPVCRMRLKTDDSGALTLRWREQSTPSLEFIESAPVPEA